MKIPNQDLGRPRDENAHAVILASALELVGKDGYVSVTIKDIAEAAKVGRQTIYRWWDSKAELLLEAIIDHIKDQHISNTSIEKFMRDTFNFQEVVGETLLGLMADAQRDKQLQQKLADQLISKRRNILQRLLNDYARETKKQYCIEIDTIVDMLFGAMWYRLLNQHAAADDALAHQLAQTVDKLLI